VSTGEHPGFAHFGGLGELAPHALVRLRPDGVVLQADTVQLAVEAWEAFTAPVPAALTRIALRRSAELRFLGEAFARLMQEYPSRSDGLSLTERRILLAVQEGAATAGEVFGRARSRERRPYLGDLSCFAIMRRLAAVAHPLLVLDGDLQHEFGRATVHMTGIGAEVLAGRADHAHLNSPDRWIGGTHLTAAEQAWRNDERLKTLIQQ